MLIGTAHGYAGLMFSAFLAATILPFSSEALLAGLFLSGGYGWLPLWFFATVGNVAGSLVNWLLGRFFLRFRDRSWFPLKGAEMEKTERHYRRFGQWSLLLAWVPIVGDPLTVMAGVFRTPLPRFILLVTLGKGGRYLLLLQALEPMK